MIYDYIVVGAGSASINGMIYLRGNRADNDSWLSGWRTPDTPNLWEELTPENLELVAGVRLAREIAATGPLAALTAGELAPGAGIDDDEQLRAWIRAGSGSMFHPAASCAMGGEAHTVCDPDLRVRGVAGLRVVDASAMPVIPRGNTNAPTIALAERAADLIRGVI